MKLCSTLIIFIVFFQSCAHYFRTELNESKVTPVIASSTYCLMYGEGKPAGEIYPFLRDINKEKEEMIKLFSKKYPGLVYDCKSSNSTYFRYWSSQQVFGDVGQFLLGLGILPIFMTTKFYTEVYNGEQALAYRGVQKEYAIVSSVFIPLFFLYKTDDEMRFEQFERILKDSKP